MEFEKEYRTYKVLGVYGSCTDDAETFFTVPKESLTLDLQGIIGERHYGYELISGPRQVAQYQRGTLIRIIDNGLQFLHVTLKRYKII